MKFKKTAKKLISLLCSASLVLSLCTIAGNSQANTASAAGTITPDKATSMDFSGSTLHTISLPASETASDITLLTIDQPGVLLLTAAPSGPLASTVKMNLFSDAACTASMSISGIYLNSTSEGDSVECTIPTAGTYYLKTEYSFYNSQTTASATINFSAVSFSSADTTLQAGVPVLSYSGDYTKDIYHKIVMKKAGAINVVGSSINISTGNVFGISVQLCNSKKIVISNSSFLSENNDYSNKYVLKKGTYYLKVADNNLYTIAYENYKYSKFAKAGSSQKKAVKLKKKKTIYNIMPVGDKSSKKQWYKVTLPKSGKMTVSSSGLGNNGSYYKLQIIPANKRQILTGASELINVNKKGTRLKTKGKIQKGTYYICITKNSGTSDGVLYSLKVNY